MTSCTVCTVAAMPCAAPARPGLLGRVLGWLWRALTTRPARRHAPPDDRDLLSLSDLSDATLKDIGVPDGVRHYAAQRREQSALLRQVEAHRGGVDMSRW